MFTDVCWQTGPSMKKKVRNPWPKRFTSCRCLAIPRGFWQIDGNCYLESSLWVLMELFVLTSGETVPDGWYKSVNVMSHPNIRKVGHAGHSAFFRDLLGELFTSHMLDVQNGHLIDVLHWGFSCLYWCALPIFNMISFFNCRQPAPHQLLVYQSLKIFSRCQ